MIIQIQFILENLKTFDYIFILYHHNSWKGYAESGQCINESNNQVQGPLFVSITLQQPIKRGA